MRFTKEPLLPISIEVLVLCRYFFNSSLRSCYVLFQLQTKTLKTNKKARRIARRGRTGSPLCWLDYKQPARSYKLLGLLDALAKGNVMSTQLKHTKTLRTILVGRIYGLNIFLMTFSDLTAFAFSADQQFFQWTNVETYSNTGASSHWQACTGSIFCCSARGLPERGQKWRIQQPKALLLLKTFKAPRKMCHPGWLQLGLPQNAIQIKNKQAKKDINAEELRIPTFTKICLLFLYIFMGGLSVWTKMLSNFQTR